MQTASYSCWRGCQEHCCALCTTTPQACLATYGLLALQGSKDGIKNGLTAWQFLQWLPAGRAGRRNSQFPVGFATCLDPADVPVLREAMAAPMSDLSTPAAGVAGCLAHLTCLLVEMANQPLSAAVQVTEGSLSILCELA